METVLSGCGYFSEVQQKHLLKLLAERDYTGGAYVVNHIKDNDYFLVYYNGKHACHLHICNCLGTILELNNAHQILIEKKVFDMFSYQILQSMSDKTQIFFNLNLSSCYLWDEGNMFAFANATDSYYYKFSDYTEYKQKMFSKVFNFACQIYDIRVMRLIANTYDFKFEFSIDDFCAYYISDSDGAIEFCFKQNRSTVYKVVNNQLVKVEKTMEKKPEKKKFLSGEELAARHIANLREYMLKHKDNNVITLPKVYETETARAWLHRLCASRGFEMMTENSITIILTFTGESDGKDNPEFSEFATAEARSQIYISNMEETITRHTADENCENSFTVNSYGYTKSSTFLKWLDNHCKEYSRTYSIDHSKYDVTITFFN